MFRKSAATWMERAGLSARDVADQLGHARVSMTPDVYCGRRILNDGAADALDDVYQAARGGPNDDEGGAPVGVPVHQTVSDRGRATYHEPLTWEKCSSDWTRTSNHPTLCPRWQHS
ncbi:tyrosine-type recombinase/integrase [Pseudonocardia nantongensis]|uniref:tyrosine-type recombinase/integrase n=1 Tax=Pseudonocardia nantongensis TaxID=1181885 RepID=UPI00397B2235